MTEEKGRVLGKLPVFPGVPRGRWRGLRVEGVVAVPVASVLELARVLPDARYVAFTAGDFTASLSLEEATGPRSILALRLNGKPLPPEHGGPCRLVVAGKACYYGVKWVERVRVAADPPLDTARDIALSRLRA